MQKNKKTKILIDHKFPKIILVNIHSDLGTWPIFCQGHCDLHWLHSATTAWKYRAVTARFLQYLGADLCFPSSPFLSPALPPIYPQIQLCLHSLLCDFISGHYRPCPIYLHISSVRIVCRRAPSVSTEPFGTIPPREKKYPEEGDRGSESEMGLYTGREGGFRFSVSDTWTTPPPRSVKNNQPFIWLTRQTGALREYYLSGVCATNRQAESTLIGIEIHTHQQTPTDKGTASIRGTRREDITLRGGVFCHPHGLPSWQVKLFILQLVALTFLCFCLWSKLFF